MNDNPNAMDCGHLYYATGAIWIESRDFFCVRCKTQAAAKQERERLIERIIEMVDRADFMWSSPRNFKDRIILDIRNADLD